MIEHNTSESPTQPLPEFAQRITTTKSANQMTTAFEATRCLVYMLCALKSKWNWIQVLLTPSNNSFQCCQMRHLTTGVLVEITLPCVPTRIHLCVCLPTYLYVPGTTLCISHSLLILISILQNTDRQIDRDRYKDRYK